MTIVQGHAGRRLPPTSTYPGNTEKSLFVSDPYFTYRNVKYERHTGHYVSPLKDEEQRIFNSLRTGNDSVKLKRGGKAT